MSQSSTTQALEQEVTTLREQLLDVGDDVTDLTGNVRKLRQAFRAIFEGLRQPVPDFLQDNPPPGLTVIRGDGGEEATTSAPALRLIRGDGAR